MRAPLDGLDLNLLVTLAALLREESVTRAGQALGTTQPTVSRALAALRLAFDDPLLVRAGRGMEITAFGASLRGPVERLLADIERLRGFAEFEPAAARRRFRLLVPDVIGVAVVPALLGVLRGHAPGVRLAVMGTERDALGKLLDGEVDLVVGAPVLDHPELHTQVVARDIPWRVVFGPRHPAWNGAPLDLEAWLAADHLQLTPAEAPDRTSSLDRALAAQGLRRRVVAQVSHLTAWVAAIESSDLVGSLPAPTARVLAGRGTVRAVPHPLSGGGPPLSIRMTWHLRRHSDAGHRWLRGQVLAVAAERLAGS